MTTFKRARTHCCVREKRHKEKQIVSHAAEGRGFLGAIRSPSFPKLNRGTARGGGGRRRQKSYRRAERIKRRFRRRTWRKSRWCASARRFVKRTTWLICAGILRAVDMKKNVVGLVRASSSGFQRYGRLVLGFRVFVVFFLKSYDVQVQWRCFFFKFVHAKLLFKSEAVALRPFLGVFVDAFRATRARAVILLIYIYFYFYF